jgi:nucleobase:cation symporter-1, NCS1 family
MAGPLTTAPSPARNEQLRKYVESRHIDHIPTSVRHGTPSQQFAFWYGANVNVFNLVLGGVVVSYGLSLYWSLIAIAIGVLVGALLIALHATQGPKLGVPQMIQSRGQFGFYGAGFLFPCVILLNVGFIAAQLVVQAQSLFAITSALTMPEWILLLTVPSVVIGIFGYRWIHYVMQGTAVLLGISLVIMLIQGLVYKTSLPASATSMTAPSAGLFMAAIALLVIDMLSFGPFVSDYSRYLPEDTNGKRLFWAIYAGNVLATIIACGIGAFLASLLPAVVAPPNGSVIDAVKNVSGDWALIVLALSLVVANTFNAYTGAFQLLSIGNMWRRFKAESIVLRVVPYLVVMAAGVVIAVLGYKTFVTTLQNFLDVLLVIFIPWSAVNLADYFIVRHGNYDVNSFFTARGRYGLFAWRGLVAYAVGLAIEWPFVYQPDYTGPLVKHLGGADISWIVGWIVAAAVYLILVRVGRDAPVEEPAPAP